MKTNNNNNNNNNKYTVNTVKVDGNWINNTKENKDFVWGNNNQYTVNAFEVDGNWINNTKENKDFVWWNIDLTFFLLIDEKIKKEIREVEKEIEDFVLLNEVKFDINDIEIFNKKCIIKNNMIEIIKHEMQNLKNKQTYKEDLILVLKNRFKLIPSLEKYNNLCLDVINDFFKHIGDNEIIEVSHHTHGVNGEVLFETFSVIKVNGCPIN